MYALGIYRMNVLEGPETAKVLFKPEKGGHLGEITREIYERDGCKPSFESLPTQEEFEADDADKT